MEEKLEKEKEKIEKEKSETYDITLAMLNQDIKFTKDDIKSVELVMKDANDQLVEVLKSVRLYKTSVKTAQSLLKMSLDRKRQKNL